jgi:hypothetical protein
MCSINRQTKSGNRPIVQQPPPDWLAAPWSGLPLLVVRRVLRNLATFSVKRRLLFNHNNFA